MKHDPAWRVAQLCGCQSPLAFGLQPDYSPAMFWRFDFLTF